MIISQYVVLCKRVMKFVDTALSRAAYIVAVGKKRMSLFGCQNRLSCTAAAVIASIIIGIITAFLRITAVIAETPAFLWLAFGIAVGYLAVTLIAAALKRRSSCCAEVTLGAQLAGVLGTLLFSVILLAVSFAATSVVGAIITGVLLFFVSLTLTSTACLVKCLFGDND